MVNRLAPIPVLLLTLIVTSCAAGEPRTPTETSPAVGIDDLVLDGQAFRLDGTCEVETDGVVADFEAIAIEGDGYAQLRFTGETGTDARATFSLDLGQGLIASTWDGATADFDRSLRVVVGDGVLTGAGSFLDPAIGAERDVAFRVSCSGAIPGGVEVAGAGGEESGELVIGDLAFTPIATCVASEPTSVSVLAAEDPDVLFFAEGRADGSAFVEIFSGGDPGFIAQSGTWNASEGVLSLGDFELRLTPDEVRASGRVIAPSGSVSIELRAPC